MNRLYLYAGIAAVFLGLSLTSYIQTKRLHSAKVELATATATIKAERDNLRKANESSERYAISLENLKAARSATPVRTVRLCAPSVPKAGTATGTDAASQEGVSQVPGPDLGPDLYQLADEADELRVRLEALQNWVRDR
jgi:hypothetical protein